MFSKMHSMNYIILTEFKSHWPTNCLPSSPGSRLHLSPRLIERQQPWISLFISRDQRINALRTNPAWKDDGAPSRTPTLTNTPERKRWARSSPVVPCQNTLQLMYSLIMELLKNIYSIVFFRIGACALSLL